MYLMSDLEMSEMRLPMNSDMVGDGGGRERRAGEVRWGGNGNKVVVGVSGCDDRNLESVQTATPSFGLIG